MQSLQGIKTNIYIRTHRFACNLFMFTCAPIYRCKAPLHLACRILKLFCLSLSLTCVLSLARVVNRCVWHYYPSRLRTAKTTAATCRVVLVARMRSSGVARQPACLPALLALLYHKRICLGPDWSVPSRPSCVEQLFVPHSQLAQLATHNWSVHNKNCKWKIASSESRCSYS